MGKYLDEYFVSSYQKIGTFRLVGERKQGGNVASYFTTAQGKVVHLIAGPVDAQVFLDEARWVVEMWKLAELQKQTTPAQLQKFFRKAHTDRLEQLVKKAMIKNAMAKNAITTTSIPLGAWKSQGPRGPKGFWIPPAALGPSRYTTSPLLNTRPAMVHQLLTMYPLPRIEEIFRLVFEKILHEKLSTVPVKKG